MNRDDVAGEFIKRHRLPASFARTADQTFVPLCEWINERVSARGRGKTFVLGLNGAQGTGKSTLADFIEDFLSETKGLRVVTLSIDDLYLNHAQRQSLASTVHPLLATRGVPGTHDVGAGLSILGGLTNAESTQPILIPRFDKLSDEPCARSQWSTVKGPVDLVIFEGWCVGSTAVPDGHLFPALNQLEDEQDTSGVWRRYVNLQLQTVYPPLFGMIDALVYLSAPDSDCIRKWRLEQEVKLAASSNISGKHVMTESEVDRFIQHFERVTRQNIAALPESADVHLALGQDHGVISAHYRDSVEPRPHAG